MNTPTMRIIKIVPFTPYYMTNGNKLVRKYEQPFTDKNGNSATLTIAEYTNKKGELLEAVVQVKWNDPEKMYDYTKNLYDNPYAKRKSE